MATDPTRPSEGTSKEVHGTVTVDEVTETVAVRVVDEESSEPTTDGLLLAILVELKRLRFGLETYLETDFVDPEE